MGLGPAASTGTIGLIAPTLDITHTGQEEVIDGVRIVFQLTPGTEAPAEMNFHFPARRALCLAENVTRDLHNLLTLRGAQVRDPRIWSRYIAEAMELFGDGTDVAFHPTRRSPKADLTLSLTHPQLLALLASGSLEGVDASGDLGVIQTLVSLTDEPDASFPIVTP
jgi:alkyl sulfatase BDS1-like metallo-beta-lactamase superfamily hydrolase